MAPLAGSPVIDAGNPAAVPANVTLDQRGFLRVVGSQVDIGAVEFQPPGVTMTLASSANPSLEGQAVTFTATVTPAAAGPNNPLTGTVNFTVDGVFAGQGFINALNNVTATFVTSALTPGNHTVQAEYFGNTLYSPAVVFLTAQQRIEPLPPPPPPPPVSVGVANFAVGPDRDAGPTVRYFNPDGTEQFNLIPFDSGFTGGVRVATADFNGDGVPDLAVGTGPGIATSVHVFDGKTRAELFTVAPFEPSFTGGVYIGAGDLTGDGHADLVVTPDEGGGPRARVFSGAGFAVIADFFGIDDPNFRGGARAAVGDVTGDGTGDLVVAAGFGGGPRLAVFDGKSVGTAAPVKPFPDFFVFEPGLRNGVFVAAGDLDGDGFAEVIAGGGPGGAPRVFALSGHGLIGDTRTVVSGQASSVDTIPVVANFFAGDPNSRGGVRVAVKSLDADGRADLLAGSGTGAGSRLTAYLGKSLPVDGSPPEQLSFDAFPGFAGGIFVG
jgi:hypothetical protein